MDAKVFVIVGARDLAHRRSEKWSPRFRLRATRMQTSSMRRTRSRYCSGCCSTRHAEKKTWSADAFEALSWGFSPRRNSRGLLEHALSTAAPRELGC